MFKILLFYPFERRWMLLVVNCPTWSIIFHHPDNKEILHSNVLDFTWNASLKASTSRQKASSRESLVRLVLFEEVRMVRMLSSRLSSGVSVPLTRMVSLNPAGASMAVSSDFLIITFTFPCKVWRRKRKTSPATGAVVVLPNVTLFYLGAQWQVKRIGKVEQVKIVEESSVHMR